jgi:hypothetical protein
VLEFWWWTGKLSETRKVLFQKLIWEISASLGFYYQKCSVLLKLLTPQLAITFLYQNFSHRVVFLSTVSIFTTQCASNFEFFSLGNFNKNCTNVSVASGHSIEQRRSRGCQRFIHFCWPPARLRPTTLLPPRSKIKPEAVNAVLSSWLWAWRRPKHVERHINVK